MDVTDTDGESAGKWILGLSEKCQTMSGSEDGIREVKKYAYVDLSRTISHKKRTQGYTEQPGAHQRKGDKR